MGGALGGMLVPKRAKHGTRLPDETQFASWTPC